jgi:hypothetical protein
MSTGSFEVCDEEFFRRGDELSVLEPEDPTESSSSRSRWMILAAAVIMLLAVALVIAAS